MSERVQQQAKARAEAARQRERRARERAQASEKRGDLGLKRLHRASAERQADVASKAKTLIDLDQQIEGDQLKD